MLCCNLVSLPLQCLDNVPKVSLPAQTAAVLPGGGSAMETMTVLMDLMRCRNLMFGCPFDNILYYSEQKVNLYVFSVHL